MYQSCPQCHKRMRRFDADEDGGRQFYVCPNCGHRWTYNTVLRGFGPDWPTEIFDKAVSSGLISENGQFLDR